jgi:hypothetical protein
MAYEVLAIASPLLEPVWVLISTSELALLGSRLERNQTSSLGRSASSWHFCIVNSIERTVM